MQKQCLLSVHFPIPHARYDKLQGCTLSGSLELNVIFWVEVTDDTPESQPKSNASVPQYCPNHCWSSVKIINHISKWKQTWEKKSQTEGLLNSFHDCGKRQTRQLDVCLQTAHQQICNTSLSRFVLIWPIFQGNMQDCVCKVVHIRPSVLWDLVRQMSAQQLLMLWRWKPKHQDNYHNVQDLTATVF